MTCDPLSEANIVGVAMLPRAEYDAAIGSNKRRAYSPVIKSEDAVLTEQKRRTVQGGVSDLYRNFSALAWAANRHLDYNTQFNLQSKSGEDAFDEEFELIAGDWMQPQSFEVSGRHDFDSFLRLLELNALLGGDCGAMKLQSGHVQGIESDLIRNPDDGTRIGDRWVQGVNLSSLGRALDYAIWRRGEQGSGYVYDRRVSAASLYLHGYFHRFDQVRGVSPLVSALNDFQDVYEIKDLAKAKMKVQQLFALVFYRDADIASGQLNDTGSVDEDGEETNRAGYQVDFGKGPVVLDLEEGDRAEMLKDSGPGVDTQAFMTMTIQLALKALDIPFSFFNESFTNFFGSRSAWLHYERSCTVKRRRLIRFSNDWLAWRCRLAITRGELRVPASVLRSGFSLMRPWWEFVPVGMPWWDPSKEVEGDLKAIEAGLTTPQRVCRQRGTDFYENLKEKKAALDYAASLGVPLTFSTQPQAQQSEKLQV